MNEIVTVSESRTVTAHGIFNRIVDKGTGGRDDVINVKLSKSKYPESTKHIEDAIKRGQPDTLTINRGGTKSNRKASLKGIKKVPGADLDECPPQCLEKEVLYEC